MVSQSSKLKDQNYSSKVKIELRERCYNFSISVIKFLESLPEKQIYKILSDQVLRSSTSISANIVEAKSASSKKDFFKYYEIALKSANTTVYWLRILKDSSSINMTQVVFYEGN